MFEIVSVTTSKVQACEVCGDALESDKECCTCGKYYISGVCPECGMPTYEYNDPAQDSTMGTYCTNKDCNYTENQFMTWEEIKELEGLE